MPTPAEAAVLNKLSGQSVGISTCELCRNRAEVHQYPDGRKLCGDCIEVLEHGRQQREDREAKEDSYQPLASQGRPLQPAPQYTSWCDPDQAERARLIEIITREVKPMHIEDTITELLQKNVFQIDFARIIQNERWFSLIDLRRLAFKINPEFDKPSQPVKISPEKPITKPKRRQKCRTRIHKTKTPNPTAKIRQEIPLQPIPEPEPRTPKTPIKDAMHKPASLLT